MKLFNLLLISFLAFNFGCGGGGGSDSSGSPDPAPVVDDSLGRVWTVAEILAEPRSGGAGGTPKCGGENGFRHCLCPADVPSGIVYRPAVAECNGRAAAILFGSFVDIFSVVVRDSQNRDRWPEAGSGYGGCNFSLANSESPPNSCSAFKVQDKFLVGDGAAMVHCFGESGYSDIFADVTRLTIKFDDNPFSSDDTIGRYCINGPDQPLN